jgi:hypothetical protein
MSNEAATMRDFILEWIKQWHDFNSDLFFNPADKKNRKLVLDEYGIATENNSRRWPVGFDFSTLPDIILIKEYTYWCRYSFRQR